MLTLGDMAVFTADPKAIAPKLAKALAVIGKRLKGTMLIEGYRVTDSCILSSLVVRDFLLDIGFTDARVASVLFHVRATKDGKLVHSLAIGGAHEDKPRRNGWIGHLVCVLPETDGGWLIDPTLTQAMRSQWPIITAQGASRLRAPIKLRIPERTIAGFVMHDGEGYEVEAGWIARPSNTIWQNSPDTIAERRFHIVKTLKAEFAPWREKEGIGAHATQ